MVVPLRRAGWIVVLAPLLALATIGIAVARPGPPNRASLALLLAWILWCGAKESFVRGHIGVFFLFGAGVIVAAPWRRSDAHHGRPFPASELVVAGCWVAVALALVGRIVEPSFWAPRGLSSFTDTAETLLSSPRRVMGASTARATMRSRYSIPDELIAIIGSAPVQVEPAETGVVWA